MVERAVQEGAELLCGGKPANVAGYPDGFFFEPTILGGVDNGSHLARNEVFGPVLSVIRFKDEEDAIRIANDVIYGLAAGVWTQSVKRATIMPRRIRSGTVWVNTYRAVSFTMPLATSAGTRRVRSVGT